MKTKKLLAFLLTILMIGGMLPTVFAEDSAEVVYNPVYSFVKEAYNCPDNYYTVGATNYTLDLTQSAQYEFVKNINSKSLLMSSDGVMPYTDVEDNYGKTALVFKGYADCAGLYDVTVNYTRFKYSGKIGLYFVPASYAESKWGDIKDLADIAPVIEDANTVTVMDKVESNLQELNLGSSVNKKDDTYSASGINLTEKEFYIFIVVNKSDYKTNDGARYYSVVKSIELDSKMSISVSGKKDVVKPGKSTQLSVSVTDDNDASVEGAEITYKSSNEDAVTVSEEGLIEAVGRGKANITVSAKVGEITVSETFEVSCEVVWNPKYVFNTTAFIENKVGTNLFAANDIENINTAVSAPWSIETYYNMTNKYINTSTAFFCTDPINKFANNAVVMKIATDSEGIYQPTLAFTKTSENGKLDMYFISAADVAASGYSFSTLEGTNTLMAKSTLGLSVDQAPNSSEVSPVTGESFYLPAGESYIIMVTSKGCDTTTNGSGYYYCYFSNLTLNHVEGFSARISNRNITIGKSADITAVALDAEGKALPGEITFESSDPSVARIEGSRVIGVDEGKATITAKVSGTNYIKEIEVNVSAVWDPVYNFTSNAVKELIVPSDKAPQLSNVKTLNEEISTGVWKYVSEKNIYASGLYDGLQYSVKKESFNNNALVFELTLDKPGAFVPTLTYMMRNFCGRQNVYAVPFTYANSKWNMKDGANLPVAEIVADENTVKLASVNLYTDNKNGGSGNITGEAFSVDEKSVYLMFVLENNDENIITDTSTRLWGYPETLTLTKVANLSADAELLSLAVGEVTSVFASVFDNRDNEIFEEVTYENLTPDIITLSGCEVMAVAAGTAKIKATANVDGVAVSDIVTINVSPKKVSIATDINGELLVKSAVIGEDVTITAPSLSGKTFRYWVRGTEATGLPVSESTSYTFKAVTNAYYTAVYTENAPEDAKVVEFYLENGGYAGRAVANAEGKVELPETPTLTGYVFNSWKTDAETEFTANTIVDALLTKVVATFDAIKIGDKSYGDEVKNTESSAKLWKRDGKVVAYGTEYTYYVWEDSAITSEDGSAPDEPIIVLDSRAKSDGARMIEYDAAGFEIIEAGILFGNGTDMTVESCMYKAASKLNLNHGQFTAKPANDEYKIAIGYIIYEENGEYKVVYSK